MFYCMLSLFNFLDWVLVLPKRLEAEFWLELKAYEEERKMPYITSVERIGYDRGLHDGREAGVEKERRSLILLLLGQKFSEIHKQLTDRIEVLSSDQLKELAIALLRFESVDDLTSWLESQG